MSRNPIPSSLNIRPLDKLLAFLFLILSVHLSENLEEKSKTITPNKILHIKEQFDNNQSRRRAALQRRHEVRPGDKSHAYPNWGYEPYWAQIYSHIKKDVDDATGKKEGTLCGNLLCPEIYINYGVICGRNSNMTHRTFKNYCELLDEDCLSRLKWTIIYRGACQGELKTYPPHAGTTPDLVVTRAIKYLEDFEKAFPSTTKPPRNRPHDLWSYYAQKEEYGM